MVSLERIPIVSPKWRDWSTRCRCAGCSSQSLLRALTLRHLGIRLADYWYCSPSCFEQAAGKRIVEMCATPSRPPHQRKSRIPLGLLLHSRGVLTKEQLQRVLDWQRTSSVNFGEAAQHLGFATPEQVTAAVAAQWGCAVFPLGEQSAAIQIRIPRLLLELYGMLPVHFAEKERKLLIGFVSGVSYQILYTIEHITSCVVEPCFITAGGHNRQLHSPSSPFLRDDELRFEQAMAPAEIARIIRNHVVQLGAAQVRIGKCRNYLWARIWGRKRETDLLFWVPND